MDRLRYAAQSIYVLITPYSGLGQVGLVFIGHARSALNDQCRTTLCSRPEMFDHLVVDHTVRTGRSGISHWAHTNSVF